MLSDDAPEGICCEHSKAPQEAREAMRSRRRLTRMALGLGALSLAVMFAGFFVFASFATRPLSDQRVMADGIVVLTGGEHRLRSGGNLLRDKRAKRLLISGANRIASRADLRRLTGLSREMFDCCVDIGYEARNTRENADETAQWLRDREFEHLIVVTSSYHMPRSMAELARRLPGVTLHPHPVRVASNNRSPWWLDGQSARTLVAEYIKFLPSAGWYVVAACLGSTSGTGASTRDGTPHPADRSLGRSS